MSNPLLAAKTRRPRATAARARLPPSGGCAGPRERRGSARRTSLPPTPPHPMAENKLLPRNCLKQRLGPRCPGAAGGTGPGMGCAPRRFFCLFGDLGYFLKFGRGWRPGAEARWHYPRSGLADKRPPPNPVCISFPRPAPLPRLSSTFGPFLPHPRRGAVAHRVPRPPPQAEAEAGPAVQNTPAPRADKAAQTRRRLLRTPVPSRVCSAPGQMGRTEKNGRVKFYGC